MKYFMDYIAKATSLSEIKAGEEVEVKVDLILGHDGTWPKVISNWKNSDYKMAEGNKVVVTVDHAFPAPSIEERLIQEKIAQVCKDTNCDLYNHGEGVLHQVLAENYLLKDGMIIVGADGHVATAGAFGAIAFSLSGEELVPVLETGKYKFIVPEVVTFKLNGKLKSDVMARDIALYILGKYADVIKGRAIALRGSYIESATTDSKMTLCNLLPEAGVFTAFVVDEKSHLEGNVIEIDMKEIEAMVAVPPGPTYVKELKELKGEKITVAIIGGCSAGRIEDIQAVSKVIEGKKVHQDVTLIITPASVKIANEMDQMGLTKILRNGGAVIMPPGCGPCPGKHFGILSENDIAITTTIRNSPGRIGSKEAKVYLASPISVVNAAIKGFI